MDRTKIQIALDELLAHRTELLKAIRSQHLGSGFSVKVDFDEKGYWMDAKVIKQQNLREGDSFCIECNPFKSRSALDDAIFEWEEKKVRELGPRLGRNEKKSHDLDDEFFGRGR